MILYHKPFINRHAENAFVAKLLQGLQIEQYVTENYPINEDYLIKYVDTVSLIRALENDQYLPNLRKDLCIETLRLCPPKLQVTPLPNNISIDVVIVSGEGVYYWEFNEYQHRTLSNKTPSLVYDADTGNPVDVPIPRYLQRLIRDVWRVQHFRPLTIVWKDWFQNNEALYKPELQPGLQEYLVPGGFSFKDFSIPRIFSLEIIPTIIDTKL